MAAVRRVLVTLSAVSLARMAVRVPLVSAASVVVAPGGGIGAVPAAEAASPLSTLASTSMGFAPIEGAPAESVEVEGKVVLVVNTASLCGYTPQLGELQTLYDTYKSRGFVVLGVPSNDFGAQEPWEEPKVSTFYSEEYGVTFPLTAKQVVVGPERHPFYAAIASEFGEDVMPQWNFHKFLVGPEGNVLAVFPPKVSPTDRQLMAQIESALPE